MRPAWAHSYGCKSRRKLITTNGAKRNCTRATECGEEAWSVNREPMNKNCIEGAAEQGEWATNHEALVIKTKWRRCGGCAMKECVPYLLGWKAYFGLAQTPRVWRELDEWLRHRMRAIQLKQWKQGTTMYRELLSLGAPREAAQRVAANGRRWWRNSGKALNSVFTISWFDQLHLPRLS